jgi:acetylornithine deacetylase/succinyl-diaminopimelate desuccinylase-like protein
MHSMIDGNEVLDLARSMIKIPSTYNHEERISRYIFRTLDRWGLSPRTAEVPGCAPDVLAETGPPGAPSLLFNGHMDTVEVAQGWKHDPLGAQVARGRLYGLGSLDMKSGLAGLMIAFRTVAENRLARGLNMKFQAVSGEELNGIGTRVLVKHGEFDRAKAVVVGEGFGGLKVVTNARRGGYYYDIHVRGKSAHGALPEMGINAVVDASRIVCAVDGMKMIRAPGLVSEDLRPLRESQMVQRISGGTTSLSVPDTCSIRIVRSVVPRRPGDPGGEIAEVIDGLGLRSQVCVELDDRPGEVYEPYLTSPTSVLVKVARETVREVTGSVPRLVCGVSEADDNIIAKETGAPVICVGPGETGELAKYHQAEESVEISQLKPACEIYCRMAMALAP